MVSEAGSKAVRLKFEFWRFLKILYLATCKCFVIFNAVLYIIWTIVLFRKGDFRQGDFRHVKCL